MELVPWAQKQSTSTAAPSFMQNEGKDYRDDYFMITFTLSAHSIVALN